MGFSFITVNVDLRPVAEAITQAATTLNRRLDTMSEALDRITQQVAEQKELTQSAVTLITNLGQEIRDRIGDDAALEALADELDQSQAELAEAISANTPAEVPPVEEPEVPDEDDAEG